MWIFLIFVPVGLGLFGGGTAVVLKAAKFKETALVTKGTITNISSYRHNKNTKYTVSFDFYLDDMQYGGTTSYHVAGMRVGGKIKVLYDMDNPWIFRPYYETFFLQAVLMGIGLGFMVLGSAPLILSAKAKKRGNSPEDENAEDDSTSKIIDFT